MTVRFYANGVSKQAHYDMAIGNYYNIMTLMGYEVDPNGPESGGSVPARELRDRCRTQLSSPNEYVRMNAEQLFTLCMLACNYGDKMIRYC